MIIALKKNMNKLYDGATYKNGKSDLINFDSSKKSTVCEESFISSSNND
jgi:hypothetical protein